jgi:hypothetical protein
MLLVQGLILSNALRAQKNIEDEECVGGLRLTKVLKNRI